MEQIQIKELFVNAITTIPGVVKIVKNDDAWLQKNHSSNCIPDCDLDKVWAVKKSKGWDLAASIVIMPNVAAKAIIEELHSQVYFELKKDKQKIENLTIFVKGVENV
ncbi:hypothetical protein [Mycoplasmopsis sturni]|uniref:hypothetical protein n=1 Tax=Mycoplasmopsis sturni TaxID=39047 RepID=UPI00056D3805|nr:hypothetical protein [Mycoplasmopsis sturni]